MNDNPRKPMVVVVPDEVKPALCLDLDGTVRCSKSGGFIQGPDDIVLLPNVEEKIWEARRAGYLIFGVSNQGGVAFGIKTFLDIEAELSATLALFQKNPFHVVKQCYHHPDGKIHPYKYRSLLRKPDIGMLALCEVDAYDNGFVVDWPRSLFVGDRPEDKECAKRAGVGFRWAWDFFGWAKPEKK